VNVMFVTPLLTTRSSHGSCFTGINRPVVVAVNVDLEVGKIALGDACDSGELELDWSTVTPLASCR